VLRNRPRPLPPPVFTQRNASKPIEIPWQGTQWQRPSEVPALLCRDRALRATDAEHSWSRRVSTGSALATDAVASFSVLTSPSLSFFPAMKFTLRKLVLSSCLFNTTSFGLTGHHGVYWFVDVNYALSLHRFLFLFFSFFAFCK
jgi:hypothetical protein